MNKHCSGQGWKPAVGPQLQLSASPLRTVSVCQQQITTSGPSSTISFSFLQTKAVCHWDDTSSSTATTQALLSGYTAQSNTELCGKWAQSQHSKNSEVTWVHELYTARPTQGYCKSRLFRSFVILATALHGKAFIGYEIKFMGRLLSKPRLDM